MIDLTTVEEDRVTQPTNRPGRYATASHIEFLVDQRLPFALIYADLLGFTDFVDTVGVTYSDTVLLELVAIFEDGLKAVHSTEQFIGHLVGGRFAVASDEPYGEQICESILEDWSKKTKVPTLALGLTSSRHHFFVDAAQPIVAATELMELASTRGHIGYEVDRRSH